MRTKRKLQPVPATGRPARAASPKQEAARRANWRLALVVGSPLGRFEPMGRADDDDDLRLIAQAIGRIRERWWDRRAAAREVANA